MTQDMHVYGIKKRATSKMNRSTHTLSILLEQLRSSLGAGKEQPRSSLEAGKRQSGVRLVVNEMASRRQRDYGSSLTRLRLVIITLLTLMTFGATNAWAQTDFSGTYYIANDANHAAAIDTRWYLVPGADPHQARYADAYFSDEYCSKSGKGDYKTTYGDPEKPFLTTYQTNQDLNSIWIISSAGDGSYYIKHAKTGKYIIYEPPYQAATNRKSVHLESTETPGENAKFTITGSLSGPINISPKSITSGNMYFNPATGVGNRASYYAPSGDYWHDGMIGLWKETTGNSGWYLEKTVIPPTITYNEETGEATITSVTGTTIHYEFDGTVPTGSSATYSAPVSMAGHTIIMAIAVDAQGTTSNVVTLNLKEYTYKIVNRREGVVAIQHTIKQVVGKQLSDYNDIPAAIRSPYLEGEDVTFLSDFTDFDHLDDYKITKTPSEGTDIYVVYTTTHLGGKFLHLSGARPLNLKVNGDYISDSGTAGAGTFAHKTNPDEDEIATNPYFWFFEGEDPYAIEIRNGATNNYIGYATPSTLSLGTSPANRKFVLMAGAAAGDGTNYEQMELMAATGDGSYYRIGRPDNINISTTATGDASLQIQAYPNSATVTYKLIDQAGKVLLNIETKSDAVELPSDWQSPLVDKYNYWKVGAFDITGDVYKLKADPESESFRINNITDAEDNVIYVTYEVNDKVTFDISDDDKTHSGEYQTYMLRFYQGQYFNQENGTDGIETSTQQAEYPYSNGDAMLYVYSDARRETQFASGASTRPRWLWYAVSPKEAKIGETPVTPGYKGDPYHVKIMSHSADVKSKTDPDNTKHQNFFRTYMVNYGGSDHVVTGLTTKHADVTDEAPTEYMVLSAPNGRYKLVTLNEIEGAPDNGSYGKRQTVNTFEQYWKNNPTVQNKLTNKVSDPESANDNGIELTSDQVSQLPGNWHSYQKWAQAAPWVKWSEDGKTGKQYHNKHHWFQTIDMGATGEFTFEAATLEPEVILLDQHGWEIMRAPLADAAALRKYDSPMVQEYQWYPTAAKVTGYHKYKVSDPTIIVYESYVDAAGKTKWQNSGNTYTHTSTSLADNPYDHFTEHGWELQDKSVKTDFYVTYTVKPEYARLYAGAATESAVNPSAFMVKQGNEYAKINNSNQLETTTDNPYALASIGDEWHWYVKPNFNIDKEMGYEYDVEEDDGAGGTYTPNQAQKDAKNYEEGRNGFDPYNVQIQSVKNGNYYFKTTTTGSHLNKGAWEGTSADLSLKNMSAGRQENVDGNDQTKLSITNATFMVVKDASGHMLLMPRFDNTKVVNSFSGTQLSAPNAATQTLELIMAPKVISNSGEFASMNGQYTLAENFEFLDGFESLGSSDNPFTGSIDGALHTLTGLSTPLIAYANGAIVKNIILENVTIGNAEDVPNVGAIVANATGETRIYNCGINSGTVSGTGNVGSIVGNLDGSSRVINCYSYANVTGTTNTGGIVGYNAYKSTSTDIRTMVMNCMFYGDVTGGNVSPIYGGEIIANLRINNSQTQGLNNFNYYAYEKATSFNALRDNNTNKVYNNALAIEERFLTRFEIYRQLLNSNRKLAAYYATSSEGTVKPSDMMKWVLETADRSIANPKPYPVLKTQGKYPSIINYDVTNAPDSAAVGRNHGGMLGKTLTVHLTGTGITTSTLTLQRTDKDFDRFNFNYDKVQLPYFNDVGTGNYTNNQVVTGWKIKSMSPLPASDPYTIANYPSSGIKDYPDHNYADRKSVNKDLFSVSGRVFSQGAYFDVPYGVSEIWIEPYWGTAAYVADEYLDYVYDTGWTGTSVTQLGKNFQTGKITINGSEQTVYKSIGDALKNRTSSSVYDLAIVLVGNLHQGNVPSEGTVPFTIMSVDLDHDNEPDYSYIYSHGKRNKVSPIRFDFINVPGTAQAQKPRGATQLRNAAIFNTIGWFELTNTTLMYFSQIEYENNDQTLDAPMILQGGVVDQFVSTVSHKVDGNTIYIHVGGNAWFKSFTMGTHGDGSESTPHVPVSVTGGDYDSFYLTGMYNSNAKVRDDNAECYISGGRFGEVAGAGQEQIGTTGTKTNGNIRWQIYNADISEFYGGGINEAKPVQGNIQTDIFNSYVDKFCGGPKFGNMAKDKTVVTNATGCTFEKYFGAGNGGNSYSRKKYYDQEGVPNENTWNTLNGYYTTDRGKFFDGTSTGSSQTSGKDYGKKGYGVATDFDYEFFVWTSGTAGVRIYVNFASFSLAQCNDVTSTLTNCIINQDFYGGGNLGSVVGTATSTLDGCTVHGNVFGGGYSAELPKIPVRDAGFTKYPNFNTNSGMFEPGIFSGTTDYDWTHVDSDPDNNSPGTVDSKYVKTKVNLTALGQVAYTDLTVTNNCKIDGGVFGGGDMSDVNQNTLVKIENVKTSGDIQNTIPNVYGGGNTADVLGDTEVRMTSGTVSQDIYGGGKGETTVVGGNVIVKIGSKEGEAPSITYSGTGIVQGDVYGGSALGDVNAKKVEDEVVYSGSDVEPIVKKTTTVNIYAGTVNGSVFGGGRGDLASLGEGHTDIDARNFGNTTIIVENNDNTKANIKGAVYGGSNVNGVLKKNATVTLLGGTIGDSENQNKDVVFGGGYGAPTLVNGDVTVNIGEEGQTSAGAIIYGHVYGGGALGNTNEAWVTDTSTEPATTTLQPVANTQTLVNLLKGTINGYAYGGGLGDAGTAAIVGGDVIVTLNGAKVQQVFGANNINGTPKGHVKVWVKKTTGGSAKDQTKTREQRTATAPAYVYDVEAIYGGGNMADYVPTKATGTPAEQEEAFTEVIIEGCELTSIDKVYGGGNAAAVPATNVTVKGTYIINTLYGGGNGAGDGNLGANVGYRSYSSLTPTEEEKTSKQYGTGKAETKLLGGYINDVYGGSNTRGDVRGGTDVRTKGKTEVVEDCCEELNVGNIYGAGSHADVKGDVNIILECMPEDYVDAVYGGAEEATIDGDVELTVTSGKFGRVFGGNNKGGNIRGSITVNVNEDGCKPLIIGELYGGGNAAPYSVFGCTKDGETWTASESGTTYYDTDTQDGRDNINVNVIACTSVGKVFGGGMGATAKVIGNTHVNINMFKGWIDDPENPGQRKLNSLGKIGQVFGGGGEADVIGNTLVNIGTADGSEDIGVNIISGDDYLKPTANENTTITAGVYGGGYSADVIGNTTLNIGTVSQSLGTNITGNIFGGGFGKSTTVSGDVTVNIGADNGEAPAHNYVGYANITGDVYGGSAMGKVNATKSGEPVTYTKTADATTQVNFYGGTIKGNLYGGGEGQIAAAGPPAVEAIAADVYGPVTVTMEGGSVYNVFGCNNYNGAPQNTVTVNINGGTVNFSEGEEDGKEGNVYGGGNQAAYIAPDGNKDNPAVNINNGTVTRNVFGGGLGTTATVTGNPHVTIGDNVEGHTAAIKWSVYGGGSLATVDGNTNIVVNSGTIGTPKDGETVYGGAKYGNIYGGGFGSSDNVRIGLVKGNTNVTVNGGNVLHSIYGGGAYGSVGTYTYKTEDADAAINTHTENTGKATIRITGGTIGTDGHENGMIFGASRGDIAAPGAIQDNMAWVYDTEVIIGTEGDEENVTSPLIRGSLYGSGENGHTFHDAKVTIYSGMVGITATMPSDPEGQGGSKYPYRGNVYGGGCGTDMYYEDQTKETHDGKGTLYNKTAGIVGGDATVTISGGHVVRNVYGAGAMGSVTGKATVNISGKSIIGADGSGGGYIYTAARGNEGMADDCATVGSTELNISGGTVWGSAFGGGQLGTVKGSVAVNVRGGIVKNDVYGGGALANTNTDNWDATNNTWKVESSESTDYYVPVKHLTAGTSVVTGYYTESGGNYTEITTADIKADANSIYYKKLTYPANIHNIAANGTTYKTTVNLTGGVIGNAYGGGLGQLTAGGETTGDGAVQAMVYGDVNVTVDGAAFTALVEASAKNAPVTGRVFGCNNINGTPKGKVTVVINKTKRIDGGNHTLGEFEIQGVYGGGNLAEYVPETYDSDTEFGQGTKVIINDCEASISKVYGGGNAAVVPYTDVTINGAFEIGYVFGGGNGGDMINKNGNWIDNTGADVTHYTNVLLKGGTIGQAFGGSDSRGTVGGSNIRQATGGLCPLRLVNLYGAGNGEEASSAGDINIEVSGCGENNEIQNVFGGSYKANITGSVTLTIKSGIFTSVYGGNDRMGSIGGNITVNIEETDDCDKPIIIQNLYGGCYQTAYPGANARTWDKSGDKSNPASYTPFTSGKITVNVKSATRIDRIFGGSERGDVTGDTEVNINMIRGSMSGHDHVTLPNYYAETGAFVPSNIHITNTNAWAQVYLYYPTEEEIAQGKEIPTVDGYYIRHGDSEPYDYTLASGYMVKGQTYYKKSVQGSIDPVIGTIGDVFGGGNIGKVTGSTVVNIGTEPKVTMVTISDKPETTEVKENEFSVLGAHINGDVFGGCNSNVVTGDAIVNICTANYSALGSDFEGIYIDKTDDGGGSVYGGGKAGDVLGNTNVTMAGGYVYDGVYGGGLMGSVGTFTRDKTVTTESNNFDHSTHKDVCLGKPTACTAGGTCTVVVSGGQVGPVEVATKGMKNEGGDGPVDVGFVFGAGRGDVENPNDVKDADFHTFVNKTDVTISGGLIMASVYGGGENGRVLNDTHVKIKGGQIGCGDAPGNVPKIYTEGEWTSENAATFKECLSWDYGKDTNGDGIKDEFLPYDPFAAATDTEDAQIGSDGHTYYGSVFGGGSGYFPYEIKNIQGQVTGHEWLRSAGAVYGNTVIDITGGHILTCVYGGNETTDVGTYANNDKGQPLVKVSGGKCTINMVGGTIGVPRTDEDATKHPVTCYLFGAGKGDQRTHFNTWTNVQETEVNVSGTARIFGSVFGGGEDGHILGDAQVNIGGEVKIDLNGDGDTTDDGETFTAQNGLKIGTTGTSYVDGNVFGGGRGFSGVALTAGSTGGNAEVNIFNGTMLGSIYGGGRLASVGIDFTPPTDPLYGQLVDDDNTNTHGHITINISGGTIGNDVANAKYGGNVFGGSMGRITLLDGSLNPIWPKQAVTKVTEITITGNPVIKKSVYGGSEYGIVRDKAIVNIGGTRDKSTDVVTPSGTPTIHGSVYGGGYGSDDTTPTYITAGDYAPGADYVFTPMIWTGCVSGDTEVNIAGGTVEKNVYGGGEVASVGLINCHVVEDANGDITVGTKKYRYTNLTKHADIQGTGENEKAYGFALSWPYKFEFISGNPREPENIGGKATVNVTGGHIGSTTWDDRTGYVFGGSKGQVAFKKKVGDDLVNITNIHEQRYIEGLCANVRETEVNVKYSTTPSDKTPSDIGTEANCIMGAVYGGGEDGHVYENAAVNVTGGLIGLSVYGGGKGEGTYPGKLYELSTDADGNLVAGNTKVDVAKMPSWTAGKVYGNTTITMSNGHVMGNVYGGGNLGSVGKGNYAGGTDDYYPAGYGETLTGNLWDNVNENSQAFLSSGKTTIKITGGTVGTLNGLYGYVYGTSKGTPTGIVFGGSRGRAARDVGKLSPRYNYAPDFFMGYVNNTEVTIGTRDADTGPRIFSQVFGGARDGHVRGSAKVEVNSGTIGQTYAETEAVGTTDVDYQRYHRGNVYGSGSGLGTWDSTHHGTSSGSVTRNTTVDIYGGTIYNNVYGGGAMATVGPPQIGTTAFASSDWSKCTVNIYGGTIGDPTVYDTYKYGGTIYGGSRGDRGGTYEDLVKEAGETINTFATVLWTEVNIKPHPTDRDKDAVIAGNVYGGARGGQIKKDTKVNLLGGVIKHNAYGGGRGTTDIAADVLGNTTVELNKGVADNKKGSSVDKVFGCNDLNGTPKGHVLVHVYATQNSGTNNVQTKVGPGLRTSLNQGEYEGYVTYLNRLIGLAKDGDVVKSGIDAAVITAAQGTISGKTDESTFTSEEETAINDAAKNVIAELQNLQGYDVTAVYGGGDLAPYVPAIDEDQTEVIIEGCGTTSIKQVYGGGNAAYVPATNVLVTSAYVIDELFGGGNGLDNYVKDGKWYENPGANVGYKDLAYYDTSGSHGDGYTEGTKYTAITYTNPDATTPEGRKANYPIGTGIASTTVNGGYIHNVYGGSNKKGNIRAEALLQVEQAGTCTLITDEIYSGSKEATIDAETNTVLDCVKEGGTVYGGSYNADILNDVHIRITNGTYAKVFGGNNKAGTISGSITVDIEERGCTPIIIGELYAGGYLAPYSVYGYSATTRDAVDVNGEVIWVDPDDHTKGKIQQRIPYKKGDSGALATPFRDPQINIISATSIGKIYGGGFQADLIGSLLMST